MYSVAGLEGKIAPYDLFEYEYDIGTSGNSSKIATTEATTLPTKEARIVRVKKEYCNALQTTTSENGIEGTYYEINYNGTIISDTLVIPYQVEYEGEMYTITEVGLGAYWNNVNTGNLPKVKTIIYPNTVKKILQANTVGTFYASSINDKIENVILPKTLVEIGNAAFCKCIGLKNITIPASVTSINNNAFYECNNLTTVNYAGTEEQWKAITIGSGNSYLTNATINYNYTGE